LDELLDALQITVENVSFAIKGKLVALNVEVVHVIVKSSLTHIDLLHCILYSDAILF
jgi:hypothetical protein